MSYSLRLNMFRHLRTARGDPSDVRPTARSSGREATSRGLRARFETAGRPTRTPTSRTAVAERSTGDADGVVKSPTALAASERFLQSTLDALSAHIAILDHKGRIVAVNEAWRRFARGNGLAAGVSAIGTNYLELCATARGAGAGEAAAVGNGIRAVMERRCAEFTLEYPCDSPNEERWFVVRATRFTGDGPVRVVVAHENITARRRMEEELRQKTALLEAQVGSSIDGILVVDRRGRKILQNRRLADLLQIPQSVADDPEDERLLLWVAGAAKFPEAFLSRVRYLNSRPLEVSRDELAMKDGRILDRYSSPMTGGNGTYLGRV